MPFPYIKLFKLISAACYFSFSAIGDFFDSLKKEQIFEDLLFFIPTKRAYSKHRGSHRSSPRNKR